MNVKSMAKHSTASSGVAAVMSAVGFNLTDFGLTQDSVVFALLEGKGEPADIKAAIFHLFFR